MLQSYVVNMDAGDFLVILALVFFAGFVTSVWMRHILFRLDLRLTMMYLSVWWSREFDWQKRKAQLEKIGIIFPLWEGISIIR